MIKYVFAIFLVFLYAHLYLHFLVNPSNLFSILTYISKESISEQVYMKQPFLMDGIPFRRELPTSELPTGEIPYESTPLLEPFVKFFPLRKRIDCLKKKWMETNDSCRTFYRIHQGSFHVTCIHPYKTDLLQEKKKWKKLKKNEDLIQFTLHEDSLLFLPNYWNIYIEPLESGSKIEKIQYYTPLNLVATTISKLCLYICDAIPIGLMKERLSI